MYACLPACLALLPIRAMLVAKPHHIPSTAVTWPCSSERQNLHASVGMPTRSRRLPACHQGEKQIVQLLHFLHIRQPICSVLQALRSGISSVQEEDLMAESPL